MNQTSEKQHLPIGHQPHYAHHQQQQQQQFQQQATNTLHGFVSQSGPGADLMKAPSHHWQTPPKQQQQQQDSSGPATTSTGLTLSPNSQANQVQRQHQQKALDEALTRQFGNNNGTLFEEQQFNTEGVDSIQQLINGAMAAEAARSQANLRAPTDDRQATTKSLVQVASFSGQQQQHHTVVGRQTINHQRSPLFIVSNNPAGQLTTDWRSQPLEEATKIVNKHQNSTSGAPNMLMVNGRPHKLIAATSSELARRGRRLGYESSGGAGFESEPVAIGAAEQRREYLEMRSRSRQRQRSRSRDAHVVLAANQLQADNGGLLDLNNNNQSTKQQASFTLLSASQLDRLSKKLLAKATGGSGNHTISAASTRGRRQQLLDRVQLGQGESATLAGNKYKLIARYRPVKEPVANLGGRQLDAEEDELEDDLARRAYEASLAGQARPLAELLDDSTSPGSSTSPATDSDEAPTARVATTPEGLGPKAESFVTGRRRQELAARLVRRTEAKMSTSGGRQRQRARASLASLRQTEELNLNPSAETDANRDLLLGKCK